METWKQYASLATFLAALVAAGLLGFRATGGSLPWAERSAETLRRGLREGGGSVVDLGRGIFLADPIREAGLVTEYLLVAAALVAVGVGVYVYVRSDRYRDIDEGRETREP